MKIISAADVMVINGGGMEGFLEDIVTNYPNLTIIDASKGITMLQNEDHEDESEEGEDDHHDHGEYNPHVWLNPKLYIEQIENVRDGLKDYLNSQNSSIDIDADKLVQLIDQNAQSYIQKVMELDSELDKSLSMVSQSSDQSVTSEEAVIFHDSFAYFIDRIGMSVAFTVPLDSDTALSAYDIGEIINAVRQENIKYLFTEQQYSDSIAKQIEAETEAKLYIIDSIVTGNGSMDSYLDGMRNNIEIIKAAMK
jgi:zinc transport system substrate-binding protein